jgi:hypothetical protein
MNLSQVYYRIEKICTAKAVSPKPKKVQPHIFQPLAAPSGEAVAGPQTIEKIFTS